jgi:hypothetical protein
MTPVPTGSIEVNHRRNTKRKKNILRLDKKAGKTYFSRLRN